MRKLSRSLNLERRHTDRWSEMRRTNRPDIRFLQTTPLLLVVQEGPHRSSVGCYTCVDTLCKWLQLHLEVVSFKGCTFWTYQWLDGQWTANRIDVEQGLTGMLRSLGRHDGLWECPQKRKAHAVVKEFHSIHPHDINYSIVELRECARPKDNASYNRIHQWEGSYLVECITTKTLRLDSAVATSVFPTAALSPAWRSVSALS